MEMNARRSKAGLFPGSDAEAPEISHWLTDGGLAQVGCLKLERSAMANPELLPWAAGMALFMVTLLVIAIREAHR